MDAANAILIGALDACAMGKYEADPSGAELLRTQLTEIGGDFTLNYGPWIIVATVVIPALIAGWLASKKERGEYVMAEDLPERAGQSFAPPW